MCSLSAGFKRLPQLWAGWTEAERDPALLPSLERRLRRLSELRWPSPQSADARFTQSSQHLVEWAVQRRGCHSALLLWNKWKNLSGGQFLLSHFSKMAVLQDKTHFPRKTLKLSRNSGDSFAFCQFDSTAFYHYCFLRCFYRHEHVFSKWHAPLRFV